MVIFMRDLKIINTVIGEHEGSAPLRLSIGYNVALSFGI
jgi:hypothetical protein